MTQASSSGQWLGKIAGTNAGYCVLNIDPDRPFQGIVQVEDGVLSFSALLTLAFTERAFTGSLSNFAAQPQPPAGVPPTAQLPKSGIVNGTIDGETLTATWQTDVGTLGTVFLSGESLRRLGLPTRSCHGSRFENGRSMRQGSIPLSYSAAIHPPWKPS